MIRYVMRMKKTPKTNASHENHTLLQSNGDLKLTRKDEEYNHVGSKQPNRKCRVIERKKKTRWDLLG